MKRLLFLTILAVGLLSVVPTAPAHAAGISIQPALVKDTLKEGEKKKGFVDVVNPTSSTMIVKFTIQAFRQADDDGTLAFYDDERIARGVKLDVPEVELAGHEALRLYYQVDGAVLARGDIMAALFATVEPTALAGAAQAVRVGTLLVFQNGQASRNIDITSLDAPSLQFGPSLTAEFTIKNNTPPVSGFFPRVSVATTPYGQQTVDGPLVTSGRQRAVSYVKSGNYIGPVKITVNVEGKERSKWVVAITGFWRWLAPLTVIIAAGAVVVGVAWRRHRHTFSRRRR